MMGNYHVRFLGGKGAERPLTYPVNKKTDNMNPPRSYKTILSDKIKSNAPPRGVIFIRKTLTFIAVLFSVSSLIEIGSYLIESKSNDVFKIILQTIILWITIYGISKTKSWTVVFVILCSYFGLILGAIDFFYMKPNRPFELFQKLILFTLLIFWAFQVYIFSKRETKSYFNDKGDTLIS